jgi:hypothetical protein
MSGRRMASVLVVVMGVACGLPARQQPLPPACPPGAVCRQVANPVEAICSPVPAGTDDIVRYTVFLNSKDTVQIAAFTLAMDMWNSRSELTGVKFEKTSDKKTAQLQFQKGQQSNNPGDRACAAYDPASSLIWYTAGQMRWAADSPRTAAKVYAHELGHALALCHLPREGHSTSIMHDGPEQEMDCQKVAEDELGDISLVDAQNAQICAAKVRSDCLQARAGNKF